MSVSSLSPLAVWYAVLLLSLTLHEAAHAFAANWGGDHTAYVSGQATLNPLPHLRREPIGMAVVPLLSFFLNGGSWMFGWASVPYNPLWAARKPRSAFLMSLAGPLANLALALAAWSLMAIGLRTGVFVPGLFAGVNALVAPAHSGAVGSIAATVVDVMFRLNLVLFVFNLIPLPPMDGSEVWYLFIGREEERFRWKRLFASYSLIGILVAWRLFPRLFEPVFLAFLNALYRFAG